MKECCAEMWDFHGRAILAITTAGTVSRKGCCAMPRGCARQARERFPGLDAELGQKIQAHGNHVYLLSGGLVSFPVENSPYECPSPALIERSCAELVALANQHHWHDIVVPRPGCGCGGLSWTEVRPIVRRYFDERFTVICSQNNGGDE